MVWRGSLAGSARRNTQRSAARQGGRGPSASGEHTLKHSDEEDTALDCTDWRVCGGAMKVTPPGSKKTRRINVVVAFVVSLFVFIWHSVVNVTVLPWLEGSVQGVTHVGLFSLLTAAGLGMYFCCVFTDPGRVPSGWLPDTESAAFVEVKKKVWALSVLP